MKRLKNLLAAAKAQREVERQRAARLGLRLIRCGRTVT
jgi:hypothetical protein